MPSHPISFPGGCTALITGASAGIGAEFARRLAPRAKALVLVARRIDRLEALKAELAAPGLEIHACQVDLAEEGQLARFLEWLDGCGLRIDLLINNAGLGDHGAFETADWARIDRILAVNIRALTRLTHHLLPALRRQPRAAILNVSSIAGMLPVPHLAVYAASKAFVSSFSEALRVELRRTHVTVTALCPGPVHTEFGRAARRAGTEEPPPPEVFTVPCEQVVREALEGVARNRARVIPGMFVAAVMLFVSLIPIFILRFFLSRPSRRVSVTENA